MVRKITYLGFEISFWDSAYDVLDENRVNAIPGKLSFETVKEAKHAIDILFEVTCRHGYCTPETAKEFDRRYRLSLARREAADRLAHAAAALLRTVSDEYLNCEAGLDLRTILQDIEKAADVRATRTVPGKPDKIAAYINEDGTMVPAEVAYPPIRSIYRDPVEVEYNGTVFIVVFQHHCSSFSIRAKDGCSHPKTHEEINAISELARPLACC